MASVVPRFDFRVDCAAAEDMGRSRQRFEDAHLVDPDHATFAVADGMGAHPAGDVAAKLAIEAAAKSLRDRATRRALDAFVANPDVERRRQMLLLMRAAVEHANEVVRKNAASHPERHGMGTTLDVVVLVRNHAFVAHAGDGRVYLARARAMLQLTQDHGKLERLKADGVVRPSSKGERSALINAVGLADVIGVDTLFVNVNRGDRILLCTDGVHAQIDTESRLAEILRDGNPRFASKALVKAVSERGRDNATAVVVEIGDRFVKRAGPEHGFSDEDLAAARQSALLAGLPDAAILAALAASVELEFAEGNTVPRVVASDLVAYIVLDGVVHSSLSGELGKGAVLFPESLMGAWDEGPLPVVRKHLRALRLRADDFAEICEETKLGIELYKRLGRLLARICAKRARLAIQEFSESDREAIREAVESLPSAALSEFPPGDLPPGGEQA